MIRIHYYNMVIIITPTCPPALAEAVIRGLDQRPPRYVEQTGIPDNYRLKIPKFSAFIGQLGRCGR